VQLVADDGQFVDQGDVHVPVGVLQQLGHLGLAGALRLDDGVDELAVEGDGARRAGRRAAADHLGCGAQPVRGVAGVDALG
jgi:hypothetical protein